MKFSIVVPVYNRERIIYSVIDSVIEQSYSDWELLLIDDGSTDLSADVCREAAGRDSRIHYFYKTNGGVSSARNFGIREATGDFIVFLDSDNTLKNNTLEELQNCLQDAKDIDIIVYGYYVSASSKWIPAESSELIITRDLIRQKYLPTHFNILAQDKYFLKNFVWNKAFRRSFLENSHIVFDETRRIWEDGIFVINCLDKANKIAIIRKAIYSAYCEQEVEHLSSKLYVDQILQYINDETEYKARFGNEMDFSTAHYINSNFNVVSSMFERMVHQFGEASKPVIEKAIRTEIVQYWAQLYRPENKTGSQLKKYILSGSTRKIYDLYNPSLLKRIVKKAIRSVKH